MKKFFRKFVLFILRLLAKRRLKSFNGKVIAITGSVGKSSTKEAIFTILNTRFKVKRSRKSMNTDFGLPLTILDIDSGFSSAIKWGWLLLKAFYYSLHKDLSDVLLVEFGVDKPGDMDYLTSIVKPDIAVMTGIAPVHLDEGQFKGVEDIFAEKSKVIEALKPKGIAILNADDVFLNNLVKKIKGKKVITFGKGDRVTYKADSIKFSFEGLKFNLQKDSKNHEITAKVLGEYQVYAILPALICGELFGLTIEECVHALQRYLLPPGRMTVIPAKEEALILDSSYNSSPIALREALKVLKELGEGKRKVAVLGNMNELGANSKTMHEEIGMIVPRYADMLITVGENAKLIASKAKAAGMIDADIFEFGNAMEAAEFMKNKVRKNDLILVKGSQNKVRLENFVKELMAHPEDAKDLLARQEKDWQNKL